MAAELLPPHPLRLPSKINPGAYLILVLFTVTLAGEAAAGLRAATRLYPPPRFASPSPFLFVEIKPGASSNPVQLCAS